MIGEVSRVRVAGDPPLTLRRRLIQLTRHRVPPILTDLHARPPSLLLATHGEPPLLDLVTTNRVVIPKPRGERAVVPRAVTPLNDPLVERGEHLARLRERLRLEPQALVREPQDQV